jgi:hypothetical protein
MIGRVRARSSWRIPSASLAGATAPTIKADSLDAPPEAGGRGERSATFGRFQIAQNSCAG